MSHVMPALAWLCLAAVTIAPAQTVAGDSLTAQLAATPRIRVHIAGWPGNAGWARLERPRLAGDSLHFDRGQMVDRGPGGREALRGPLALATLDRIDRPAGTQAGRGAIVGSIFGAGLGLAASLALSEDFQVGGGDVATITLNFALLGAGVGALIGVSSPRWKPVYRSGG